MRTRSLKYPTASLFCCLLLSCLPAVAPAKCVSRQPPRRCGKAEEANLKAREITAAENIHKETAAQIKEIDARLEKAREWAVRSSS